MRILLIDNHDSFTYNLVQLLKNGGVNHMEIVKNDVVQPADGGDYDALVISPGPGVPETAGNLLPLLNTWIGAKPILGICLGHQALGMVLGAHLRQLHHILHGEISEMTQLRPSPLFRNISPKFPAGRYHSWVLDETTLPRNVIPLCQDSEGHIMAIRYAHHPTYGIQFHPESYMTPVGENIIRNWLTLVRSGLEAEGNGC